MPVSRDRLAFNAARLQAMACLILARPAAARRVFDRMLERWPGNAYALASRAHLLAQAGRRAEALEDAERLVTLHPSHSGADWFNFAFLLEEAGRHVEAEGAFRRAVALNPKLDRAWYGLGLTLIRLRRLDEALAALKRATDLQPMSPYGWYQRARVHIDREEPEEARRIIRHLKGFEPQVAAQLERETGLLA